MKNPPLILASTSKYRAQLLAQLGWEFRGLAPDFDEEVHKGQGTEPSELAQKLAAGKARALRESHPEAFIIGADQVCALGEEIMSKPGEFEKARLQLKKLQGKTHELLTAVCLLTPTGEEKKILNRTRLTMRPLTDGEIERYLQADEPYDCGGSYRLEARGITLFESVSMTDHTAIIGLPLIELTSLLLSEGFAL